VPSFERRQRLRALLRRDPEKFFWPAVVGVLIELGWKPPPPSDDVLDRILDDLRGAGLKHIPTNATLDLSPKEKQVLVLMARGYTRAETAVALDCGDETIKTDLVNIRRRLNAVNIVHAVALAIRKGIIE